MASRSLPMARLTQVELLKDLPIDLAPYAPRCNWRRFDPEEIRVDFDDLTTDVYFLLSGDVRVLMRTASGKEVILDEMRAGELFGELAAIDGIKRSANVTALTRGELCVMSAALFHEVIQSFPGVNDRLLRLLS